MSVHGLPPMQPALTCLRLAPTRSLDDRTFELRKNAKRLDRTPRRPGWWCRSPLVQIHAAGRLMPASNARSPRPAQPTYLRLWRSGDCAVRALDTPDAIERSARRRVPMAGENTPPRPPRSDDKAERMIIVRGPSSKLGAVRAVKMAKMCEFREHRPPPFPRPGVGRRANNDRLKPGGNSLVGDRAAISFMLLR
jgi:hypothetical protein